MTAGRPIEFDPDAALAAAMRLFWAQGYEATSLQDLLARMGIARSSFYQVFHSKHQLFIQALDRYCGTLTVELRRQLAASDSAREFLREALASVADDARGRGRRWGCLVFNSAAEFGQTDKEVAAGVAASIDAFTSVFSDAIRQAQLEGDIDAAKDPELLGRHMVCSMSGLRTLAKAGAKPRELLQLADMALSALD
jgi:TetR/AcrR family transcriptional regulator, transcriptional repressor for nem operon